MSRDMKFDGFPVDIFQGKLAGTFDLELSELSHFGLDEEVMLVVVGRVKSAGISETSAGDIKRVNSIKVTEVGLVRSKEMRTQLGDQFGLSTPQPLLSESATEPAAPPADEIAPNESSVLESPPPGDAVGARFDSVSVPDGRYAGRPRKDQVLARFLEGD